MVGVTLKFCTDAVTADFSSATSDMTCTTEAAVIAGIDALPIATGHAFGAAHVAALEGGIKAALTLSGDATLTDLAGGVAVTAKLRMDLEIHTLISTKRPSLAHTLSRDTELTGLTSVSTLATMSGVVGKRDALRTTTRLRRTIPQLTLASDAVFSKLASIPTTTTMLWAALGIDADRTPLGVLTSRQSSSTLALTPLTTLAIFATVTTGTTVQEIAPKIDADPMTESESTVQTNLPTVSILADLIRSAADAAAAAVERIGKHLYTMTVAVFLAFGTLALTI